MLDRWWSWTGLVVALAMMGEGYHLGSDRLLAAGLLCCAFVIITWPRERWYG